MNTTTNTLARVATAGIICFFVAAAVAGFTTSGYDARSEAISALAAKDAPHAWFMIAGFALGAVGLFAAGLSIRQQAGQRAGRAGAVLVMAAAALLGIAGFAQQDCSDRLAACVDHGDATGASTSYWIHQQVSMLAFATLIVAAFLVARGLWRAGARSLAMTSGVCGALSVVLIVLLVTEPSGIDANWGLLQRLFVLVLFGWTLLAGRADKFAPGAAASTRVPVGAEER